MAWKLLQKDPVTNNIIEYDVTTTKRGLLIDLGIEKIERSLRYALAEDRWVKPNGLYNEFRWVKEDDSFPFGENLNEEIKLCNCDNCEKEDKLYSFRNYNLCWDCYNNNKIISSLLNKKNNILNEILELENRNILVIPDLHAPFILNGYLEFCKIIYDKYNCNAVIFLGDLIDNHFSSYHDTDPDGHGAGKELQLAKEQIYEFYTAFPKALVTKGNHDIISNRKAFSGGLSSQWIKSIENVLQTPNWQYEHKFIIDGVTYTHGSGGQAISKLNNNLTSTIQAHHHQKTYLQYKTSQEGKKYYAMQLGCGCNESAYAFSYAKDFGKMQINVGVVLNNGKLPIIEFFNDYK